MISPGTEVQQPNLEVPFDASASRLAASATTEVPHHTFVFIFWVGGKGGYDLRHAINLKFGANDTPPSSQVCTYEWEIHIWCM